MRWLSLLLTLFCTNTISAQNCDAFFVNNCATEFTKFIYKENAASSGFLLSPGEGQCVSMQFESGNDYRITTCSGPLYNGVVQLLVINRTTGKIVYDNASCEYCSTMQFSCKNDIDAELQIIVPQFDTESDLSDCVSVHIEEMKTPVLGF
ncbi:MAG: hypothetical protein MJ069_06105 [Salinivirgaceae bacterium]|nr:hypothetical protein [Salinivirgaceae bacterium]